MYSQQYVRIGGRATTSSAVPGGHAFEDLTSRARIRDAALALFAERGIEGATIRDIARRAGVSGGLVRHHFGSKDDLREACDSYALDQLMSLKTQAVLHGRIVEPGFMSGAQPALVVIFGYFARSMVDGSPSAAAMFDEMVELGEQWLDEHHPGQIADARAYAAVLVAMETGILSMREQLSRALGADIFSIAGNLRLAKAKVEFYSKPLLSAALAARAMATIDSLVAEAESAPGSSPAGGWSPASEPAQARHRSRARSSAKDEG